MADIQIMNIVSTQCEPQDVDKFNKWYNEVHIPMLLKFKKLKGVARYQLVGDSSCPQYIAMYKYANAKDVDEFEKSPELAAAIKEMQGTWGDKIKIISRIRYTLIKQWGK